MNSIVIIHNFFTQESIEDQELRTNCWSHVFLSLDRCEKSSIQFIGDMWSERRNKKIKKAWKQNLAKEAQQRGLWVENVQVLSALIAWNKYIYIYIYIYIWDRCQNQYHYDLYRFIAIIPVKKGHQGADHTSILNYITSERDN